MESCTVDPKFPRRDQFPLDLLRAYAHEAAQIVTRRHRQRGRRALFKNVSVLAVVSGRHTQLGRVRSFLATRSMTPCRRRIRGALERAEIAKAQATHRGL